MGIDHNRPQVHSARQRTVVLTFPSPAAAELFDELPDDQARAWMLDPETVRLDRVALGLFAPGPRPDGAMPADSD
jgi:hypothetical protein